MPPIRLLAALSLAAVVVAAGPHASAQTQMSPPPGTLGGKQPMSNTASNIVPGDTHTAWAPGLPIPPVNDNAPPLSFLDAARHAIAANRTGEAQEALERAESRALDRAVRPSKLGEASHQPLVRQIADARHALGEGDRQRAVALIEAAMRNPEANAAAK